MRLYAYSTWSMRPAPQPESARTRTGSLIPGWWTTRTARTRRWWANHLVVMGTDGGTGLRRQLLGNVAERVLRRVAVSVTTVRKEGADLLEFDETAGRRRTRAGWRGVPLLVSSRSAPESAFLPAGPDREGSVQIWIEESRKPSALSTPGTRCRSRERRSLVMTKRLRRFEPRSSVALLPVVLASPGERRSPELAAHSAANVRVRRECLALSVRQDPAGQPAEIGSSVGAYLNTATTRY